MIGMKRMVPSVCLALMLAGCSTTDSTARSSEPIEGAYSEGDVVTAAEEFFAGGADGLAEVLHRVFNDHGPPQGYIKGTEGGGALVFGLRYGQGVLHLQGRTRHVYWNGPSIGFDVGGNAAKVFMLVYGLHSEDTLFQRFPGVEGSLYLIGGVGVTYHRSQDTVIAPVRFGVGWRHGVNVGYLKFTRGKSLIPF